KLEHEGVLTDLGQLNSLLGVARQYVITDADWDIPLFASEMHALTGKNLAFQTAPVAGYSTIDGQAANVIDIPTIQHQVRQAFTAPAATSSSAGGTGSGKKPAPAPPPSTVTVDVYNGGGAAGLAASVSSALASKGYKAGAVANASEQAHPVQSSTQVFYSAAAAANAAKIAGYLGVPAVASTSLRTGHVEVLLGTGATTLPAGLSPSSSAASGSPAATPAGNNGAANRTVSVDAKTPYGTPCVY
ncbi:MAG TPA: LytR C-terminal domain-containing protein, partial [Trebonia sp.]|nr:LytR C-terminal domain-containing protein [Trebonia sp.]